MKELFLKCDVFATSQFLRYDSEPQYRTFTGAFCSIATIVTFFAIFTNVIVATFQKQTIVWSSNTVQSQADSFQLNIQVVDQNKFMFAISIADIDLNSGAQYFDINLTIKTKINSISKDNTQISLEACTPSHWNVNEQILQSFYRMNFSKMLCPQIGSKVPLQGKFTSEIFKYAEIQISKCTTFSKVCVDDSIIQSKIFIANIYFLNSLINPQQPSYLSYYLQDRNYIEFTTTFASLLNLFISKFKISTDQSILPYQSIVQQEGPIVNNLAQVIPKQTQSKAYANIVLRRSSTTVMVDRSFKKFDETLSYIGGLFGFVMVFLMLMRQYTEYSFQIDASSHLYHQDNQNPIDAEKFNFIVFIGYLFYLFLGIFGMSPDWKMMKTFDDSRQQIQKQFDVRFLFERLNFIQKSLHLLFSQEQGKFIHLTRKSTLKEASELRQNYLYKEIVKEGQNLQITQENLVTNQLNEQNIHPANNKITPINNAQSSPSKNDISLRMKNGFKSLRKKTLNGHQLSKKIIQDLDPYIFKIIHQANIQSDEKSSCSNSMEHFQKSDRNQSNPTQPITLAFQPQIEAIELQKGNPAKFVFLTKVENTQDRREDVSNFQFMS